MGFYSLFYLSSVDLSLTGRIIYRLATMFTIGTAGVGNYLSSLMPYGLFLVGQASK